jgi:glycosyltransferase involved in cell wall biosynthesis
MPLDQYTAPPGPLRVTHIGKYYAPAKGGIETHLRELCGELSKRIMVRVLVANEGRQRREDLVDGVAVTRVGTKFHLRGAPICPEMIGEIRNSDSDLIHIHMPNPGAAIAYLASGDQRPLVLTWHSDIVRQRLLARLFAPIETRLVGRARAIIATSPDYLAYSSVLYQHRSKCRVIPFGVSIDELRASRKVMVAEIRKRYGSRLLLSVGRLVNYKGFGYLIRAMKDVEASLMIIGDGPERGRLEAYARRLGVDKKVMFLGEVSDTAPYYQACEIFVLPSVSRNEAFGIVQLEAMACGKPVINTHLRSGVQYVSINGLTGVTVPAGDSSALARATSLLLEDPCRRAAYGAAARRRVQEEFSVERMVDETLRLYEEVVSDDFQSGGMHHSEIAFEAPRLSNFATL